MIATITRQDLQTALERAKSSILGNVLLRNDAQMFVSQMRNSILQDLHEIHAENLQAMHQSHTQNNQFMVKVASLEHDFNTIQQAVGKVLDQQARILNLLQK